MEKLTGLGMDTASARKLLLSPPAEAGTLKIDINNAAHVFWMNGAYL